MQFYICVVVEHANEHIYFCLLSYSLIFYLIGQIHLNSLTYKIFLPQIACSWYV